VIIIITAAVVLVRLLEFHPHTKLFLEDFADPKTVTLCKHTDVAPCVVRICSDDLALLENPPLSCIEIFAVRFISDTRLVCGAFCRAHGKK
jgi:hypothetical protein